MGPDPSVEFLVAGAGFEHCLARYSAEQKLSVGHVPDVGDFQVKQVDFLSDEACRDQREQIPRRAPANPLPLPQETGLQPLAIGSGP